jgi:iron complex outermembrane recepter protein
MKFPNTKLTPLALAVSGALTALILTGNTFAQTSPPAASAPAKAETAAEKTAREAREKADAEKKQETKVETIVVTASGRQQSANKIPYNVTAISEEQLREENITDIKKLIAQSASINAPGNSARFADSVTVRGLNISPVNANNLEQFVKTTLAYYLDDTPLPNIAYRIKDVSRVETLLGPQGTLYGGGSLGGTVRYITNQPSLKATTARLDTSVYKTQGGDPSLDTHLVLNLPLTESVAFRASLSTLNEGGYIDRISNPPWRTGAFAWTTQPEGGKNVYKNDDWQRVKGGRLSALWKVSPDVSLTFAHTQQEQRANGTSAVSLNPLPIANARNAADITSYIRDPNFSPCTGTACRFRDPFATPFTVNDRSVISRYPEFADRNFKLDSIDLDWDFSFGRLHSSTSTFEDTRVGQADYASQGWSFYFDLGDAGGAFDSGRSAYITFNNKYKGLNHETRITSKGDGPLSWIAGLYYTEQKRSLRFSEILPGIDAYVPINRARAGGNTDEGYRENLASEYKETAVYGEIGYRIVPAWLTTIGGRVFKYDDTAIAEIRDYSFDLVNNNVRVNKGDNNKSIFKINTSYQFGTDFLAYATYSQGFRRGGTNGFRNVGTRVVAPDVQQYQPDTTDNLEAGIKGYLLSRKLYVQTNYFQIDWKNVQTYYSQSINGFPVNGTANGPDARTKGWEIQSRYRLTDNWQLQYSGAYTTAKWKGTKTVCLYTNGTSCRTWSAGGILGGTPEWKHNASIRWNTFLQDGTYLWASLGGRYAGKIPVDRSDDPNVIISSRDPYSLYNASLGFSKGPLDANLWISNLANKRAEISGQAGGIIGPRIIYATPRTIGLNLSYNFK